MARDTPKTRRYSYRPACQLCSMAGTAKSAAYYAVGPWQSWAYMCARHFRDHGCSLGRNRGHKISVRRK